MANPFAVTPLGGFNLGGAIAQLGQQFGEQKRRDEQMMQEQEFQGLLKRAYETGNQEDIAEVFSMNPQIGEFLTDREAEKAQKLGAENLARAREAEVDWGIRWKQASTPEQKEALKQEALNNPLIDIDEDDLGISGQQADLGVDAMLFGHLGKDQFKALGLGQQASEQTATQREFEQYQQLKDENPEQAKEFGMAAGFIDDGKKRLFKVSENPDGSVTKYFSDGTESQSSPTETIKTPDMQKGMSLNKAKSVMAGAKEYQTKSAGFAMRLRDSIDQMNRLTDKSTPNYVEPARAALIIKALGDGTLGNVALSPNEQEYMVNANDALFAILRPETGSAITDQEMRQYSRLYLPQPGESENATKAKKRKLENQFKSLRARAPQVYDASRIVIGEGPKPPEPQAQAPQTEQVQQFVIQNHPQFGNITEEDIQQTMVANNLTREQVMARLGNQ